MPAAMNLDRPLDDIISEKRKQQRRVNGVSRRGGRGGSHRTGPIRHARTRAQPSSAPLPAKTLQLPPQMGQGSKIIVSNLPADVTENQIRELFYTTVGPVTRVTLSYDNRGVSKGTAQVEFKRNDDATLAFQQYNKRLIDQRFRPRHCPLGLLPLRSKIFLSVEESTVKMPTAARNGGVTEDEAEQIIRAHRKPLPIWTLRWKIIKKRSSRSPNTLTKVFCRVKLRCRFMALL
ncbi:hypothetical protein O181_000211 [Austropuccinia psidii MF-1]|uniref:RRM domain-containing protein n=1 Tax=Austropuccinia psidii MF-1 TaxID=1389203 RepID=A0A9Q3GBE0_9BASI|nr:hypothetical protein [Austropuccinia psidii MF-1]